MATEIAHVIYAEKALKTILKGRKVNRKKYFLGNLFPDIRYLGEISRDETHVEPLDLFELERIKNSFELGMSTHALVDIEQAKLLKEMGIYNLVPRSTISRLAIISLEAEILHPFFDKWEEIVSFLKEPIREELETVSEKAVDRWHKILIKYFSNPPNKRTMTDFARAVGFSKSTIDLTFAKMDELRRTKEVIKLIKKMHQSIF